MNINLPRKQPHSLQTIEISNAITPAERIKRAGWAGRHGLTWPKGTVLPKTQVAACPRVRVADLPEGFLKRNHIEALEQNQMIASCCRHPEHHDVEARKSHTLEPVPDTYIFFCTCGRKHIFFCVGETDKRPMWDAS